MYSSFLNYEIIILVTKCLYESYVGSDVNFTQWPRFDLQNLLLGEFLSLH